MSSKTSMSRNNKKRSSSSRSKKSSSHRLSNRLSKRKSSFTLPDDWFPLNVKKAEKLLCVGVGSMYMRLAGQGSRATLVKVIGFVDDEFAKNIYTEYSTKNKYLLVYDLDDDYEFLLSLKNRRFVGGTGSDTAMFKKKLF